MNSCVPKVKRGIQRNNNPIFRWVVIYWNVLDNSKPSHAGRQTIVSESEIGLGAIHLIPIFLDSPHPKTHQTPSYEGCY